jgi:outer membrane protein TolC
MNRRPTRFLSRLPGLRRFTSGLCVAGFAWTNLGCAQLPGANSPAPVVARAAGEKEGQLPETIPTHPAPVMATPQPQPRLPPAMEEPAKPIPISLDTVLMLAQDQNAQVNVARERVREAFAEKDVAAKRWLPDLYIGTSYYRHEGGIQDVDGTFLHSSFGSLFGGVEVNGQLDLRDVVLQRVNAERKVWQQRGELSRITSEQLLDAANTYIDLLAAYQARAVIRSTDKDVNDVLKRAQALFKTEPATEIEVVRIRGEIAGRQQARDKLDEQAKAAKAKLAYLLGLNPEADLVPVDHRLGILNVVDANTPTADLVAQALTTGPGIREIEGLLALITQSMEKAKGLSQYLPVVGVRMAEGIFGAGPGEKSDWDNRWDLGLQVRWNLTELCTARDRQRVAQAKLNQLQLTNQDLRAKLTAGVREAQGAILAGPKQLREGENQINYARKALELSIKRYEASQPERASLGEILLAIRGLMSAQLGYLNTLRDYDKAQLRLLVLLGQATGPGDGPCPK